MRSKIALPSRSVIMVVAPPVLRATIDKATGTFATRSSLAVVTVAVSFTVFTTPPVLGGRLAELDSSFIFGAAPNGADTITVKASLPEGLLGSDTSMVAKPATVQLNLAEA